ncbi:plasmid pRiA4b ORF-3 family protein [Paenarthrobacter sp. NPDC058040]|uniref:plasmid pRiA4b ORF-3 family protein n=1 Tax=unclassified Paenarthrobacter TaxID=2634190 RepID=UPI0036DC0057
MTAPTQVPGVELRISISETEPSIWRQLVIPQTATLAELHEAIQVAFGWKNAHLYDFRGPGTDGKQRAIGTLDDDSPEGAESAADVAVLELFDPASPGTSPFEYEYDFGDSWTHEIEVVGPAEVDDNVILCTGGAMRGPVEDSGGVHGYANVVRVVGDTKHPEHREAVEWLEWVTGMKAKEFDPVAFDLESVNGELNRLARRIWAEPPSLDDMDAVLAPVLWLLQEADPDGLDLTSAGWLKPAIVKRMMTELNWDDDWIGTGRNEVNIPHVMDLREQLQRWKLLRKNKNKLLLTPVGRRVVRDPAELWEFLAARCASPDTAADELITRLVVHWELTDSKPQWDNLSEAIAAELSMHGFVLKNGNAPIPPDLGRDIYFHARRPLDCLALWGTRMWKSIDPKPTDAGIKFLLDVQSRWGASNR